MQKFFKASLLQFSGVVGAGVLTLPYVLDNSNFIFSWLGVILIAVAMILINKFYMDIVFEKKNLHQLPGYVGKHLGKSGSVLAFISMNFTFFGAMLVYMKMGSSLFQNIFHLNNIVSLLFYLLLVVCGYLFLNNYSKNILSYLPIITIFLFLVIFLFGVLSGNDVISSNPFNFEFIGPVVFALTGFLVIPDIANIFEFDNKRRTSAILSSIVGIIIALFIYYFFSYGVIALSNGNLSENSIDGLSNGLKIIISIIAILTTFRSSQNFLNIFREVFEKDLKIGKKLSFYLPLVVPLFSLFFIKVSFLSIMSWVGVGSMFVSALLICISRMMIKPTLWIIIAQIYIVMVFVLGIMSLV